MTNAEIIEMAEQSGFMFDDGSPIGFTYSMLKDFAKLVAEKERLTCIHIAENYWSNCLSRAPQGTFLTSKKDSDRNYSEGIIQGAKGLVTVLKSSDQENIYSTKIF